MKNVLIVEDSINLLQSIQLAFRKYSSKLNLIVAENGEEAIKILEEEPISVLVTDLYMPKVDGLELLAYMSQHHPEVPCIVMTAFSSLEITEILANLGTYRFLEKPFELKALVTAITDAIQEFSNGKPIAPLSITGCLSLIEEEQRSCTMETISNKGLKGSFYLVDGRLYDARCENLKGEKAAITILGRDNISFNLKSLPPESIKAAIPLSLNALLTKAENIKKEITNGNLAEMLFKAIRHAESGDIKYARDSFSKILKINPNNSNAWLWFARTTNNFGAIKVALNNAAIISPNNSEIISEMEKRNSAIQSGLKETISFKHCLFCWAPVIKSHNICHYCNAHLDIHEDYLDSTFFISNKDPDFKIILKSFQRFTKAAILNHNDDNTHFLLAMSHVNLRQWDEAHEELKLASHIAPDNNTYKKKITIISDLMNHNKKYAIVSSSEEGNQTPSNALKGRNKSIMVVEDSATTRTVIRKILAPEGYNIIEANDGIEAIAKFKDNIPDLILLDIIMPGMDGYQTLATLKRNYDLNDTPVIMLTAKDTLLDKLRGKMSGSTEYLTKPFNAFDLISKIGEHLD